METWDCYYCEKGKVTALPSDCPECKRTLTKPWDQMTDQEKSEAWSRKHTLGPVYTLAS